MPRLEILELVPVFENFNGERWGAEPFGLTSENHFYTIEYPREDGTHVTLRFYKVLNAIYVEETYKEPPPSYFYIIRVYLLKRRREVRV